MANYPQISVGIDWDRDGSIDWESNENVTTYVQSVDWQLGHAGSYDTLPAEGTATIVLNNTTRLFSPENTGGALYGSFNTSLLTIIRVYDEQETEWVTMWAGFVDSYDVHPMASAGDNQTVVNCIQGLLKLNSDTTFLYDSNQNDVFADEIIMRIFELTPWRAPLQPKPFIVGISLVGDDLSVGTNSLVEVDEGQRRYINIGSNWGSTQDGLRTALEDIATSEQGFWFVNREGELTFRGKAYRSIQKTGYDLTASTETNVSGMNYTYFDDRANIIEVIYYPNAEDSALELWAGTETVAANDSINFTAMAQRDDGSSIAVKGLASIDFTAIDTTTQGDVSDTVIINTQVTPRGIDVIVSNTIDREIQFTARVIGVVDQKRNGSTYRDTDLAKMQAAGEPVKAVFDLPMLHTRHSAARFAEYEAYLVQNPYGTVEQVVQHVRDNTSLHNILSATVESRFRVYDYQIGVENENYLVVGEQFQWIPGSLSATYVLKKIANAPDVSLLGSTNLGPTGTAKLL